MPVYKVEKYLEKCLDSIINQTYKNLQIICVDDGSPDNCGKILDRYAKLYSRIIVIHQENGGMSSARNTALDLLYKTWSQDRSTCAELITFVDSDDWIDTYAYEKCLSSFSNSVDVVVFGYECVDDLNGSLTDPYCPASSLGICGMSSSSASIINSTSNGVWNKIFKTDIVFENNIRFPEGVAMEDALFRTVYLCHCSNIFFEEGCFYKYRVGRESSVTGSLWQKCSNVCRDYIKVISLTRDCLKKNSVFDSNIDVFFSFFYQMFFTAMSTKHFKEDEDFMYAEARKILAEEHHSGSTVLQKHYDDLILTGTATESTSRKLLGLFKHSHKVDYDKYYFLGMEILKISYSDSSKTASIFGFINFKLG